MRDKRTTARYTVDGCLLGAGERLLGMESAFETGLGLALGECGLEAIVLLGGKGWSGIPDLLRRQAK